MSKIVSEIRDILPSVLSHVLGGRNVAPLQSRIDPQVTRFEIPVTVITEGKEGAHGQKTQVVTEVFAAPSRMSTKAFVLRPAPTRPVTLHKLKTFLFVYHFF